MLRDRYQKMAKEAKSWGEIKNRIYDSSAKANNGREDWELKPTSLSGGILNLILRNGQLDRALDLGCGLGRNFPLLHGLSKTVHGYDLPEIVEWCATKHHDETISGDWETFRSQKYDLILASVTIQHMDLSDACRYLQDMQQMTPMLLVLSREWMDDQSCKLGVAEIITSMGYKEIYTTPPASDRHWQKLFEPQIQ